ncbi:MAG: SIMPL domain-containing protein [Thiohalophilus sp.]|uniref:SIMPL domain-containing protein n=1 Tax=Thiohalophilus sp. TaxID=3028392 RepID=UPI00287031F5|nr:SIMPL domain-containing protein [Thiohalophilus sp.]MDR9437615.1 SIMPL domain-containing protein [Thiohalophilus sp.]
MVGQRSLIAASLSLLCFWPGVAAEASENSHYDRIHLSVSAQEEVDNDTLLAVLSAREEGEHLPTLADTVNRTVKQAIEQSKQVPAVEVRTLTYQTHPRYQKQRLIGWQVRQAIELKSGDIEALSTLLGGLQKTMTLDSLGYAVSSTRREAMEQTLISRAIKQFKQRAEHVTRQLGRKEFRLVEMDINTQGQAAQPRMMRSVSAMSESAVTAPVVEPGTQTLRVTLNATIELTVK